MELQPRVMIDWNSTLVEHVMNLTRFKFIQYPQVPFEQSQVDQMREVAKTRGVEGLGTFFSILQKEDEYRLLDQNERWPLASSLKNTLDTLMARVSYTRRYFADLTAREFLLSSMPINHGREGLEVLANAGRKTSIVSATYSSCADAFLEMTQMFGYLDFLDPEFAVLLRNAKVDQEVWSPDGLVSQLDVKVAAIEYFTLIDSVAPDVIDDSPRIRDIAQKLNCRTYDPTVGGVRRVAERIILNGRDV